MKRAPPWARPKRQDGELAAHILPAVPKRLGELADLASDPRLPPGTPQRVGDWLAERDRSAWEVRKAIERLQELIAESEGKQGDLFEKGGAG